MGFYTKFVTEIDFLHEKILEEDKSVCFIHLYQGSKIALVRSYLRVPQIAGQVEIWMICIDYTFFPYMPIFIAI